MNSRNSLSSILLKFPPEIIISILKRIPLRNIVLKPPSGHKCHSNFSPGKKKGSGIPQLALASKEHFLLVVKYTGLYSGRIVHHTDLLDNAAPLRFVSNSIFAELKSVIIDLTDLNYEKSEYKEINLPHCPNLTSLLIRFPEPNRTPKPQPQFTRSIPKKQRKKNKKNKNRSQLRPTADVVPDSVPVQEEKIPEPADLSFLNQISKFQNLRVLNMIDWYADETFSWADVTSLLHHLQLEALLVSLVCEYPKTWIPPTHQETEAFASALESQNQLVYLGISLPESALRKVCPFPTSLISKMKPKNGLKIDVYPSETGKSTTSDTGDLESAFEASNDEWEGSDGESEDSQSALEYVKGRTSLSLARGHLDAEQPDFLIIDCGEYDLKELKRFGSCTALQHLDCMLTDEQGAQLVVKILENNPSLSSLEIYIEFDYFFMEKTAPNLKKLFDTISESESIKKLTVIQNPNMYIDKVILNNASIEELRFVDGLGGSQGFTFKFPTVIKAIRKNPKSRITTVTYDYPGAHSFFQYDVKTGIMRFPWIADDDFMKFCIEILDAVAMWWDNNDFTVDGIAVNAAPEYFWGSFLQKGYHKLFEVGYFGFVEGEYCITHSRRRVGS
ncbi:hypothetical protein HK098_004524 [Nowakowskiella sp. JEL0407]|nr:hypothetical protein HK098_004524 [Nowakowskiella sp. JEL0407]